MQRPGWEVRVPRVFPHPRYLFSSLAWSIVYWRTVSSQVDTTNDADNDVLDVVNASHGWWWRSVVAIFFFFKRKNLAAYCTQFIRPYCTFSPLSLSCRCSEAMQPWRGPRVAGGGNRSEGLRRVKCRSTLPTFVPKSKKYFSNSKLDRLALVGTHKIYPTESVLNIDYKINLKFQAHPI